MITFQYLPVLFGIIIFALIILWRCNIYNINKKCKSKIQTITNDHNAKIKYYNDLIKCKEIDYDRRIKKLLNETSNINELNNQLKIEIKNLNICIKKKDELFDSIENYSTNTLLNISSIAADLKLIQFDITENYLKTKKHPAFVEAKRICDLKSEYKILLEQLQFITYKYEMLLHLFPELSIYVDDFESICQLKEYSSLNDLKDEHDRVKKYLSKEEYLNLNENERNQLALDNYINGQKTKWQIGRDYELFCGLEYETKGWNVNYYGIENKLKDMGRDLIAKKGNIHHIIQCKYWSKDKLIHEKHITQLFGTSIEYSLNVNENTIVIPVFITNINLSKTARLFAEKLNVIVIENKSLEIFPRIKCNLNRDEWGNLSKIYHLPFDQQYDRTKIDKNGEFYAYTVDEAVSKGFRRAFRYFGN